MELLKIIELFTLPFFAYTLGSIPWGVVLTRAFTSVDIRSSGSGNIGATNVRRTAGTFMGLLTLCGDVLKGAVPVWLALSLTASGSLQGDLYISLTALAAFTGHLYPVFMKFRNGGKGVATACGCFIAVSPLAVLVSLLVFILFVCFTSRVSAGSLAGAAILPLGIWKATGSCVLTGCACITGILIFFRHKENIQRLIAGTEAKI